MPGIVLDAILTYIGVDESVPDVPTVIGEALVPTVVNKLEVETSKPTGGVIVTADTRLVPETLKEVEVDEVP